MPIVRFVLVIALAAAIAESARADTSIWFEDARHSPALSEDASRAIAAYVRHRLLDLPADQAPLMPSAVRDDFFPRVILLSVSDGLRPARVIAGTARGVLKAADHAIAQVRVGDEKPAFKPKWLKLDVPSTILLQEGVNLERPLEFDRSLFGLAFPRATRVAFVPEELVANDIINHIGEFAGDRMLEYLDRRLPATAAHRPPLKNATLLRFATRAFYMDESEIQPLYRGHRTYRRITRDELLRSTREAAGYLTRSVDRYGQFDYIYQPGDDRVPDDYNIVRHFGTILSMADAYEVLRDEDLLAATKRAIEYGENSVGTWTQNGKRVPGVISEGRVTLGANALAAGATARLASVTGDEKTRKRAREFAEAVVVAQRDDGSFIQYQRFPDGQIIEFDNPYYPGEAIVSLMYVQGVSPDPRWIDVAERAANHLILVRDKDMPLAKLNQDHWLLYGLNGVARHRPTPLLLTHAARVSQAMCLSQLRSPRHADWLGGFYIPPGSTSAAVRVEGLGASYQLLRDKGGEKHREDLREIMKTCVLGSAFMLQCQFRPESAMYYRDPQRTIGAFRESLTSPDIRIDFVQHNMMALLNLWRIMEQEKVTAFAVPPAEPAGDEPITPNRAAEEID